MATAAFATTVVAPPESNGLSTVPKCAFDAVNIEQYRDLPRFLRVSPRSPNVTLEVLQEALGPSVQPVPWLPSGYYTVDGTVKLASTRLFQEGHVYGIDGSSVVAVLAMGIQPGDHVIDVSCAPGTKLCLIADLLQAEPGGTQGLAVGVDGRLQRLFIARSQVTKYGLCNVQLIWADGTQFTRATAEQGLGQSSTKPPFRDAAGRPLCVANVRKFKQLLTKLQDRFVKENGATQEQPASVAAVLRGPPAVLQELGPAGLVIMEPAAVPEAAEGGLFDAVLVDPESSHDLDVRRMDKLLTGGLYWNSAPAGQLAKLYEHQYALLLNGWRLLRPGGVLVYTTCSLRPEQNEDIVQRLLRDMPPGSVEVVPAVPAGSTVPCRAGTTPGSVYLTPQVSGTGGCFIAKLKKPLLATCADDPDVTARRQEMPSECKS